MKKFLRFLILFPVIGMSSIMAQIPEDDLVAYYPFNGSADDESGNGNDGVIDGVTLTTDRFGHTNSAYYFDGTNDRITVMNNDLIDFDNSEDFTIALWMKSSDTRMVQLINKQYPGYWNGYLVVLNSDNSGYCTEQGHILFYAAAGAKEDACSDVMVNNDEWVFVTGVYDHNINEVKLYINGYQQSDIGAVSGNIKTTQNLQIGYGLTLETGYVYYKGSIDDIRLYNRVLNDKEIMAIYHEGEEDISSGLVAFYPFNGNANDESGHGNDGVVNSAILAVDRCGNENSAYLFQGAHAGIIVPSSSTLNFENDFAIACWIKTGSTRPDMNILRKHNHGYWNGFFLTVNCTNPGYCHIPGHLTSYVACCADCDACSNDIINNERWQFVVSNFDSSSNQISLYINGVLQDDMGQSAGTVANDTALIIGHRYEGLIDDIRMYNRTLSDNEIRALYNECNSDTLSDLVAFYPFIGNANDESGNGNNGIVDGATLTTDRCDNENSAYYFDGADDGITVPNNDLIDFSNSEDFSIAFWMKTNDDDWAILLDKQYAGYWNGYLFEINNEDAGYCTAKGNILFYAAGGAFEDACSNNIVNNDEWVFITGVYSSDLNTVKLYINGYQQSDIGRVSGDIKTTQDLQIGYGSSLHPGNRHYKGSIDDIRIYNRALSNTEIESLYNDDVCFQIIPETQIDEIKIYPVPATDHIIVDIGDSRLEEVQQLDIIDILGQVVYTAMVTQKKYFIDISSWIGYGIYFIRLKNAENRIIEKKKIVLF